MGLAIALACIFAFGAIFVALCCYVLLLDFKRNNYVKTIIEQGREIERLRPFVGYRDYYKDLYNDILKGYKELEQKLAERDKKYTEGLEEVAHEAEKHVEKEFEKERAKIKRTEEICSELGEQIIDLQVVIEKGKRENEALRNQLHKELKATSKEKEFEVGNVVDIVENPSWKIQIFNDTIDHIVWNPDMDEYKGVKKAQITEKLSPFRYKVAVEKNGKLTNVFPWVFHRNWLMPSTPCWGEKVAYDKL